ncbi:MAG: Gfo/Idh/MocA family oxidoreductase [Phycisphaeraceae bacterium]|nr:Gfo/Idh/MocA family oxidoreductase [Phycisphaeraceae bacterium]
MKDPQKSPATGPGIDRRRFMQSVLATGAGLALVQPIWASAGNGAAGQLNIAMIGAGSQGRVLMLDGLKIPGIRFRAVADVWEYSRRYANNILQRFGQPINVYADYREMLAEEKDLDAVLIASPDWVHAEQTNACLEAGLHVYCEKEMSNTIEGARSMVQAAKRTGKLLQIGHQRRSNPRYLHARRLIDRERLLGRVTHFQGQWNRSRRLEVGWPRNTEIDAAELKRLGFTDMFQFRNWRWFRDFSGGPMSDLGSHQMGVFNWILGKSPTAVMAAGGNDYYERNEWFDHVIAIFEYPGDKDSTIRGTYQVLNTTSHGGFRELLMGDEGTLAISEDPSVGYVLREQEAQRRDWEDDANRVEGMDRRAIALQVGASRKADEQHIEQIDQALAKPPHQLHLENFFDTIRDPRRNSLTCPSESAFSVAVTVLKTNEAVEKGGRLAFDPAWFKV